MMLKLFLISVAIATVYSKDPRPRVNFPKEITDHILQTIDNCLTEYNIDPKAVDEIRNGEYRSGVPYENFIYCSYKNSGFAKEDGHVLVDEGVKIFPPEVNIGPVLKKCDSLATGKTPGEVTLSFFICFQKTTPALMALTPIN